MIHDGYQTESLSPSSSLNSAMHAICTLNPPKLLACCSKPVTVSIATAAQQQPQQNNGKENSKPTDSKDDLKPNRLFPPVLQSLASFPLIRATQRALSALRFSPAFTPRVTFARWRTHRAMRAAARAARVNEGKRKRDWRKSFRLNGLTWHHAYISQDLNRIAYMVRELQRNMESKSMRNALETADANNTSKELTSSSSKYVTSSATPVSIPVTGATLVHLERSFSFLLDNVFDVYNSLEKHILFPWIINGTNPSNLSLTPSANLNAVAPSSKSHKLTAEEDHSNMEKYLALQRAMSLFSKERDRIEDRADVIRSRFARVVCSTGFPYVYGGSCHSYHTFNSASQLRREKRRGEVMDARARAAALKDGGEEGTGKEVSRRRRSSLYIRSGYVPLPMDAEERKSLKGYGKKKIEDTSTVNSTPTSSFKWKTAGIDDVRALHSDLVTLIEDTERLHKTERRLLYPIIANVFSEQEQNRLTNVMVYSMRSALAKLLIAVYQQSVEKQTSRAQRRYYKREVPLPIRVYTPIWRARLYDGSPLGWLRNTSLKEMRESPLAIPALPSAP